MLGSCRECKGQASTEALACPHCGAPSPTLESSPPPPSIERQIAAIKREVTTLRVCLITIPLIVLALYLLLGLLDLLRR